MAHFFDMFYFTPGSRMSGIWEAGSDLDDDTELVASAAFVQFGPDQHDVLESNFLGAHMPFHFGGFHGVGPDGHPWAVMLQVAPASAARLVGSDNVFWPMLDGLDRALHYNWEAELIEDRGFTREELLAVYVDQGVSLTSIDDWSVPDLMLGLLAECCYVPLSQIVTGRITQCAFPDLAHDCQHDVFRDVFSVWVSGALNPPEPEPEPRRRPKKAGPSSSVKYYWPEDQLREKSTKQLRTLACAGFWDEDEVAEMKRKELVKLLTTPHWRNMAQGARRA